MSQKTKTGLDRLLEENFSSLKNKRIGLLANHASVDSGFRHIADLLFENPNTELVKIFAPEHGFRGILQDMEEVNALKDKKTGLPVISLYGADSESLVPKEEDFSDIDCLVFDLQDVGARYYTYAQTLAYLLPVAKKLSIEVVVVDRPNPINGSQIEGSRLDVSCRSFCGLLDTPNRHGITMGELALLFNNGFGEGKRAVPGANSELRVIEMVDWSRDMYFDQTGLPWVFPSPNMPSLTAATIYPGGCLFEATALSEGRGTTLPFELLGAPYIDSELWAKATLDLVPDLKGFKLRPTSFKPKFQKHADAICNGLQIHVTDRTEFKPYRLGLALIYTAYQNHNQEFSWRKGTYEFIDDISPIDLLFGNSSFRETVESGGDLNKLFSEIENYETDYKKKIVSSLLYS